MLTSDALGRVTGLGLSVDHPRRPSECNFDAGLEEDLPSTLPLFALAVQPVFIDRRKDGDDKIVLVDTRCIAF